MSDSEKIKLIGRMFTDFWICNDADDVQDGAVVLLNVIGTVVDFEVCDGT